MLMSSGVQHAFMAANYGSKHCVNACRARKAAVVVRAEEKATLDLNEGVEGGTDYSGILAGTCHAIAPALGSPWAYLLLSLQVGRAFSCTRGDTGSVSDIQKTVLLMLTGCPGTDQDAAMPRPTDP